MNWKSITVWTIVAIVLVVVLHKIFQNLAEQQAIAAKRIRLNGKMYDLTAYLILNGKSTPPPVLQTGTKSILPQINNSPFPSTTFQGGFVNSPIVNPING